MKKILILVATIGIFTACNNSSSESNGNEKVQADAQKYLEIYNSEYQRLTIAANEASWKSNTYIVEGDTATKNATNRSNEAIATYTGSNANIDSAKKYLAIKEQLTELQVKQFQFILYNAANNPESLKDMVKERIAAETEQNDKLFGYNFMLDGKKVSTNDIDAILNKETNVEKREKAWESSKQVGLVLKDGLANLQKLRNNTVKPLGFPDYFNYQVSDYGMSTEEMMKMNQQMIRMHIMLHRFKFDFLGWRGTIRKIMSSLFTNDTDWRIGVIRYRDAYFLRVFHTETELGVEFGQTPVEKLFKI